MAEISTKRCTRCGQTLPKDRFYRQGVRLEATCKACVNAARTAKRRAAGIAPRPPAKPRQPDYSPEVWDRELRAVNRAFNHTLKTIFGSLHRCNPHPTLSRREMALTQGEHA
ncbi:MULTISPECIES: hypothetical protein [Methylococcus]|uniref:Uncharacterized protein n=1 Tax=Methylococcus capsulatus (strain ATCC 33009 / NCIMB 11132 / Bath) TaxID=243233 RepID=Q602V8_METCA|nr:hypothetical protein [Methylococcus capsulatus]AAU90941.1 hypothetical protein MCA2951 [Methylococcus capsulatus str. Bath]QXP93014.1 hypothetical protein KW113_11670 [Methylococcus capsulatus]